MPFRCLHRQVTGVTFPQVLFRRGDAARGDMPILRLRWAYNYLIAYNGMHHEYSATEKNAGL